MNMVDFDLLILRGYSNCPQKWKTKIHIKFIEKKKCRKRGKGK